MDMDYGIKSKSEARTESEDRFYLLQSKVRDLVNMWFEENAA